MNEDLKRAVSGRLERFEQERLVERIWERDHTIWKPDPTELADRLGWLDVHRELASEAAELSRFAAEVRADGLDSVLLCGMGGSSLGPEVLADAAGREGGATRLVVLDSTDPAQIAETEQSLDLARTLVVVASKSGSTIETASHLAYFWERIGNGRQFVAITDAGSALEQQATERGFRRVFRNRPEIGGRYSVLSHFGMVPAALLGLPVEGLCGDAAAMAERCRASNLSENPGAWLGAVLGEAALAGRDKCTLVLPEAFPLLGTWVEQLVAESTGKEGRGILPVEREPLGPPSVYTSDRIFVAYADSPELLTLEAAGHAVVRLEPEGLGAEFFRWEFATAVAGAVLGVQPFDQPNVQEAKDAASKALAGEIAVVEPPSLNEVLATVEPGDYIAINAFIARNPAHEERLQAVRIAFRNRYNVATTVGFGPRFLHSTGQLHKGGPDSGVFIEVVNEAPGPDIPVPGRGFTFGELLDAQALGDLAALVGRGRRACKVTLTGLETAVRS